MQSTSSRASAARVAPALRCMPSSSSPKLLMNSSAYSSRKERGGRAAAAAGRGAAVAAARAAAASSAARNAAYARTDGGATSCSSTGAGGGAAARGGGALRGGAGGARGALCGDAAADWARSARATAASPPWSCRGLKSPPMRPGKGARSRRVPPDRDVPGAALTSAAPRSHVTPRHSFESGVTSSPLLPFAAAPPPSVPGRAVPPFQAAVRSAARRRGVPWMCAAPAAEVTADAALCVQHVQYRGAFGVTFFYHHGIVFGHAPLDGEPDERVVFHWSGGARDKVESLEAAEIRAVSWPDFSAGADNEHARGVIEAVPYDDDVRARNPPAVCLARARAMLGHRGLGAGVDTEGREVDGYHPLTNNCEHLAVYVMTGAFRSLQVERAAAVAGLLLGDSGGGGGVDLPGLALVAGLGLGAVLALSGSGAAPSDAEEAPADQPQPGKKRDEAAPPPPAPHAAVLAPPAADAWRTALLRGSTSLPLGALAGSGALNVELLTGEGAPFAPRRWLCAAERHDALPFGLCYGHRLHAEALGDAAAAPFLALPSFQWAFQTRRGGCPPRGLRGALCSLAGPGHALFGLDHVRTRKFIAAGVCASFPGTDAGGIFHLGVRPTRDGAAVTLTLADYTDSADDAPVHPGFALRWAEPGGAAHAGRDWPYFACTPEGVRRAAPGEPPLGASRFRFWWREDEP